MDIKICKSTRTDVWCQPPLEKRPFSVLCVGILFQLHMLQSGVHPRQVAVHNSSDIISHEDGESEPPQKQIHCLKHISRDDLWDTMKPQQYAKFHFVGWNGWHFTFLSVYYRFEAYTSFASVQWMLLYKDGITINYFQKSLLKFLDRVLAFQPSTVYLKANMWSALQVLYCWNVHAFQSREHSLVCCSRTHHNQNFRIRDQEVKMKKIKKINKGNTKRKLWIRFLSECFQKQQEHWKKKALCSKLKTK